MSLPERAAERAAEYGIPAVATVAELLADPEIEVVLNLTTPDAHASVAQAALDAGKGVYNEKPLAIALRTASGWWRRRAREACVSAPRPIRSSAAGCKPAASSSTRAPSASR